MWKYPRGTRAAGGPKRSGVWTNLLLFAGTTIILCVAMELLARIAGYGAVVEFESSADCGLLMRPSQTAWMYGLPIKINSLGLRGPELEIPKANGTKRIVFIGDSVSYGGGRIREKQLFCRIVESRAHTEGMNVEVVNLSAPSWSPQNWMGYINSRGLHEPDAVVLVLPECDLARGFSDVKSAGLRTKAPFFRLQALALRLRALHSQAHSGKGQLAAPDREKGAMANLAAIEQLEEKCKGVPLLVVLVPSEVPSCPDKDLWPIFAPHLGVTLDLRDQLRDRKYFLDGVHLNAAGHELVGENILPRLRELLR